MNITLPRAVIEQALEALEATKWDGSPSFVKSAITVLRTALKQPKRKPLSDDEIQAIWKKTFESGSSPNTFARAIEHAHNIKE